MVAETVVMPAEIAKYLDDVKAVLDKYNNGQVSDFEYWVKLLLSEKTTEKALSYT